MNGKCQERCVYPLNRGKHSGAVSPGRNDQENNPDTPADVRIGVVDLCGMIWRKRMRKPRREQKKIGPSLGVRLD